MIATGIGPSRDGCHDLPEIDCDLFHALGGEDIVVWDTMYRFEGTEEAIRYAAIQLNIELDEWDAED